MGNKNFDTDPSTFLAHARRVIGSHLIEKRLISRFSVVCRNIEHEDGLRHETVGVWRDIEIEDVSMRWEDAVILVYIDHSEMAIIKTPGVATIECPFIGHTPLKELKRCLAKIPVD